MDALDRYSDAGRCKKFGVPVHSKGRAESAPTLVGIELTDMQNIYPVSASLRLVLGTQVTSLYVSNGMQGLLNRAGKIILVHDYRNSRISRCLSLSVNSAERLNNLDRTIKIWIL